MDVAAATARSAHRPMICQNDRRTAASMMAHRRQRNRGTLIKSNAARIAALSRIQSLNKGHEHVRRMVERLCPSEMSRIRAVWGGV